MTNRRVVVTQPYVASYRVPLWNKVRDELALQGLDLVVLAGTPGGSQAMRRDSAAQISTTHLRSNTLHILGREVIFRRYPKLAPDDVLITELSAANTVAWWALLTRPSRTILWGHAMSYVNDPTTLGTAIKGAMSRRAAHVMTYTDKGGSYAIDVLHVDRNNVTSIGNSTDTGKLLREVGQIDDTLRRSLQAHWDTQGPTALYSGGLDRAKRIEFLAAAAAAAHNADPSFRLLVAGSGEDETHLRYGVDAGYIKLVGYADPTMLARLASVSNAIWMPGRIGLVAVDALALGLPVHTLVSKYHAPEIDFLIEGESLEYLSATPEAWAAESIQKMSTHSRKTRSTVPTIEDVAHKLCTVAVKVMSRG